MGSKSHQQSAVDKLGSSLPKNLGTKNFYICIARRSYAVNARGFGSRNSVRRPSVCFSVRRVLYDNTKQCTADILIPHETAIARFVTPTVVGGRRPLPSEICAQGDQPLRKTPTSTDFRL